MMEVMSMNKGNVDNAAKEDDGETKSSIHRTRRGNSTSCGRQGSRKCSKLESLSALLERSSSSLQTSNLDDLTKETEEEEESASPSGSKTSESNSGPRVLSDKLPPSSRSNLSSRNSNHRHRRSRSNENPLNTSNHRKDSAKPSSRRRCSHEHSRSRSREHLDSETEKRSHTSPDEAPEKSSGHQRHNEENTDISSSFNGRSGDDSVQDLIKRSSGHQKDDFEDSPRAARSSRQGSRRSRNVCASHSESSIDHAEPTKTATTTCASSHGLGERRQQNTVPQVSEVIPHVQDGVNTIGSPTNSRRKRHSMPVPCNPRPAHTKEPSSPRKRSTARTSRNHRSLRNHKHVDDENECKGDEPSTTETSGDFLEEFTVSLSPETQVKEDRSGLRSRKGRRNSPSSGDKTSNRPRRTSSLDPCDDMTTRRRNGRQCDRVTKRHSCQSLSPIRSMSEKANIGRLGGIHGRPKYRKSKSDVSPTRQWSDDTKVARKRSTSSNGSESQKHRHSSKGVPRCSTSSNSRESQIRRHSNEGMPRRKCSKSRESQKRRHSHEGVLPTDRRRQESSSCGQQRHQGEHRTRNAAREEESHGGRVRIHRRMRSSAASGCSSSSTSSSSDLDIKASDAAGSRADRLDDILSFAKAKQHELSTSQHTEATVDSEQDTNSFAAESTEPTGSPDKEESPKAKKNILTSATKAAGITIGLTKFAAREAVNTVTNPKQQAEVVWGRTKKTAKFTAEVASHPQAAVQAVAAISHKVVAEAGEVTKGTLELGFDTIDGTVGFVSGLVYGHERKNTDGEGGEDYDFTAMSSRKICCGSLLDRVATVVDHEPEVHSKPGRRPPPPRMMGRKMPSRMVQSCTGVPSNSWD